MRVPWQERAACRGVDADIFFPRGITEKRFDEAKKICATCSVKKECLGIVWHLEPFEDRWGVFGGLTPAERIHQRKIRGGIL
jgi:WhiB family redox-sensing transcriptional regulator